ncbi:MAG: sugar phosphate isomerase/epimerase [Oscillospiraceae bacterium]|nr:sugar phosphate isomerase/epimerase [Oscillospiraceae bacterium]
MEIGITIGSYERYGADRYRFMREDGFTCGDYGMMDSSHPLYQCNGEDLEAIARAERAKAEEAGIRISQVHGPWRWPPRDGTPEEREERLEKMKRSIRATRLLGCDYFVIHPIMPFGTQSDPDPELLFRMSLEFFRRLLPTAHQYNVTICLENMPMPALSLATPAQILAFVKAVDDPLFRICLDTGHSAVFRIQPADALRELREYVKVLHLHDNNGTRDEHRFPYTGIIDWKAFSEALQETGFSGVVSLETGASEALESPAHRAALKLLGLMARQIAGQ